MAGESLEQRKPGGQPGYFLDFEVLVEGTDNLWEEDLIKHYASQVDDEVVYSDYLARRRPDNSSDVPLEKQEYISMHGPYGRKKTAARLFLQDAALYVDNSFNDEIFAERIEVWGKLIQTNFIERPDHLKLPASMQTLLLERTFAYFRQNPAAEAPAVADILLSQPAALYYPEYRRMLHGKLGLHGAVDQSLLQARHESKSWGEFAEKAGITTEDRDKTLAIAILERISPSAARLKIGSVIQYASLPVISKNLDAFKFLERAMTLQMPPGDIRLIRVAVDLTYSLAEEASRELGEKSNAAKIVKLIEASRTNHGQTVPSDYITIGNLLTPALKIMNAEKGIEAPEPLDKKDLKSLPQALDRIGSFILNDPAAENLPHEKRELYKTALICAGMLAETGVERKTSQWKMSLGDIAIRYSHLPTDEILKIAEDMTATRYELPVNRIYHALQSRKKNRPHYRKWQSGGILS